MRNHQRRKPYWPDGYGRGGGGLVGIEPPETVADQIETALGAHQVKAGVQIEELFDDAHGDPVKVFYGLVFLGQVIEGL